MASDRDVCNVFTVYNCPSCGIGSLFPKIIEVKDNGNIKVVQCLSPDCQKFFEVVRHAVDHIGDIHRLVKDSFSV